MPTNQPADCNYCHPSRRPRGRAVLVIACITANTARPGAAVQHACDPCHSDGGVNGFVRTYQHATSAGNRPIFTLTYSELYRASHQIPPEPGGAAGLRLMLQHLLPQQRRPGRRQRQRSRPRSGARLGTTCGSCHACRWSATATAIHNAAPYKVRLRTLPCRYGQQQHDHIPSYAAKHTNKR